MFHVAIYSGHKTWADGLLDLDGDNPCSVRVRNRDSSVHVNNYNWFKNIVLDFFRAAPDLVRGSLLVG